MKRVFLSVLVLLIVGCSSLPMPPAEPISNNPAVLDLLDIAQHQMHNGDYQPAKSNLERALRLEPRNAYLWLELAEANRKEENLTTARNLALRAKTFTKSSSLQSRISSFIDSL